jgi:hypothetical protein
MTSQIEIDGSYILKLRIAQYRSVNKISKLKIKLYSIWFCLTWWKPLWLKLKMLKRRGHLPQWFPHSIEFNKK